MGVALQRPPPMNPHSMPQPVMTTPLMQIATPTPTQRLTEQPFRMPLQQPMVMMTHPQATPTPGPSLVKKMDTQQPSATELSESVVKAANNMATEKGKGGKRKNVRCAGGQIWMDPTLDEWDPSKLMLICCGWIQIGECPHPTLH